MNAKQAKHFVKQKMEELMADGKHATISAVNECIKILAQEHRFLVLAPAFNQPISHITMDSEGLIYHPLRMH